MRAADGLDGLHVAPVGLEREREARQHRLAVEHHGAGAAVALVAALLGADEVEIVAERLEQRAPRVDRELDLGSADPQHHRDQAIARRFARGRRDDGGDGNNVNDAVRVGLHALFAEARAGDRVVVGDGPGEGARGELAVLDQPLARHRGAGAEEPEVLDEQLEAGVADALADAEAGAVDAVDAHRGGPQRGGDAQPTIVVSVPVELHASGAHRLDFAARERDELGHAVGRHVPGGVAEAESRGARVDRRAKEGAERVGVRSRRVLGDEAEREPGAHGRFCRFTHAVDEERHVPPFGVVADRRAADEGVDLDRDPGALRGARYPLHVGDDGAGRGGGDERELRVADLAAQMVRVLRVARARRRETDADDVDADPRHRVQEIDLVGDGRVDARAVLQTVAERLVDDLHAGRVAAEAELFRRRRRPRRRGHRRCAERAAELGIPVENRMLHGRRDRS